jgi:hypothetical protein
MKLRTVRWRKSTKLHLSLLSRFFLLSSDVNKSVRFVILDCKVIGQGERTVNKRYEPYHEECRDQTDAESSTTSAHDPGNDGYKTNEAKA